MGHSKIFSIQFIYEDFEDDLKIITSQLISIFTDLTIKKYIYEFRK